MLAKILAHKKEEVAAQKTSLPLTRLLPDLAAAPPPRPFGSVLRSPGRLSLIGEIKPASPSHGTLSVDVDPGKIARLYEEAGAAAVSVLTDAAFFGASPGNLVLARQHCNLPLLHKEFIIDPYQLYLSRTWGADAVLLIVAALPEGMLAGLMAEAAALGLACLVEVHTEGELERALGAGASLVAINNRNLFTMEVDLETTFRLLPQIDLDRVTLVSASGIAGRRQMERLGANGVHAVLVGTALMRSPDPRRALAELLGDNYHGKS
ncbi:MAG TPA: indole-3-glycerol phosphate synthase TrpC [Spirochaetia bacterium]|nr:indole-3-glycerol phosphate synthase TrpC [Spirochaetia bacterium]